MTEPEMPRDPDLDVPTLSGYLNQPGIYATSDGMGYGVRIVLEAKDGSRFTGSFDPPEAGLEYARDLMAQCYRAIGERDGVLKAPTAPPPPPRHAFYLDRATLTEKRHGLDPKTCFGCGVVEGREFEPRHHPSTCPALLVWQGHQADQADETDRPE